MLIITSYIYQPKIKDKGSYFYNNKKYRWLEAEKKYSFLIAAIPNFCCMRFLENDQCFVGVFL